MKEVALTGSQREALCALAQDQDRPWTVGNAFDASARTIPAPIANLLAKRGLATLSGGMGRRTVTITDMGFAEAARDGDGTSASSLEVEAMAQALYETDKFNETDEEGKPYEDAATWPDWGDLPSTRAAFARAKAQMLLRRYHELLRAKRETL